MTDRVIVGVRALVACRWCGVLHDGIDPITDEMVYNDEVVGQTWAIQRPDGTVAILGDQTWRSLAEFKKDVAAGRFEPKPKIA